MVDIYCGDCLELMSNIPDKSVDLVLCDLPYGTTNCEWDVIIPFEPLWAEYKRVIKDGGAFVLFGSEPFSSKLRLSNLNDYKYDLYWQKEKPTNFFQLKRRAGKCVENICIFYDKQCTYNPQMTEHIGDRVVNSPKGRHNSVITGVAKDITPYNDTGYRYPIDVLRFNRVQLGKAQHPTQKPVPLLEYLIKTFSNSGDVILDNCMGSGSTGVASVNTDRSFIGIELDAGYFEVAQKRIEQAKYERDKKLW